MITNKTTSEKAAYSQIMKATSLFGGVQIVGILISIIRSKMVAILLGTSGIGIMGLFQTTLTLIQSVTGLGLSSSGVRDISEAYGTGNAQRIAFVVKALQRWVWITGLLGATITLSLAPLLSKWTFGNENYTWSFIWLSIICLLTGISSGQNVLLQGMRRLKHMAKSTLYGIILGLITSLPLYYYFGIKGIVPSIIISAISTLILSYYFARKIQVEHIDQKWSETYRTGLSMAKLGFIMMLSGFMVTLVSYIVNLYISNKGGVDEVGLYRAGWTITNQYVGLVFIAMGTDYYPRLAVINNNNIKIKTSVNQQGEIAILLLGPMLVALISYVQLVIHLFYTIHFMPISGIIKWYMLGMLYKAAAWVMAYVIIAKGDNRLFFITEITANVTILVFNIIGYTIWGLDGIGISFTASYLVYFILIYILVKSKYGITYKKKFWKIFVIQSILITLVFIISLWQSNLLSYTLKSLLFSITIMFSLKELNERINLSLIFKKYIYNNLHKRQT